MIDIDWLVFTPYQALMGGALIGLAAAILILGIGRILGMSGIAYNAVATLTKRSDGHWQVVFIIGMAIATWFYAFVVGFPQFTIDVSIARIVVAGVLVGFGTRLGSGCTSGHGVCGISRLSRRSVLATLIFMTFGVITASLMDMI